MLCWLNLYNYNENDGAHDGGGIGVLNLQTTLLQSHHHLRKGIRVFQAADTNHGLLAQNVHGDDGFGPTGDWCAGGTPLWPSAQDIFCGVVDGAPANGERLLGPVT